MPTYKSNVATNDFSAQAALCDMCHLKVIFPPHKTKHNNIGHCARTTHRAQLFLSGCVHISLAWSVIYRIRQHCDLAPMTSASIIISSTQLRRRMNHTSELKHLSLTTVPSVRAVTVSYIYHFITQSASSQKKQREKPVERHSGSSRRHWCNKLKTCIRSTGNAITTGLILGE